MSADARLAELGLELPEFPTLPFRPKLAPVRVHDGLAYLSGVGPIGTAGVVGGDLTVEDGYEAARQIRQALGADVMLVALTGWGQDEDKRRSKDAGFDHHLTKPPDPEVLERLIAECGQRRG